MILCTESFYDLAYKKTKQTFYYLAVLSQVMFPVQIAYFLACLF